MCVFSRAGAVLPAGTEDRLHDFIELVATAIANYQARAELRASEAHARELADEQAALRRVATLVASEPSAAEVFGAVAEEVARFVGAESVGMLRFEPDGVATLVAQSATPWEPVALGTRFALDGENVITAVFRTGEPARLDDWSNATGSAAAMAQTLGIRSSVATPIVVEGRLWGTMVAVTQQIEPLAAETESRIGEFTELLATAISNAEARGELAQLADEQAALRRIATLVAQGVEPQAVFAAVALELGALLGVDATHMGRYEPDGSVTAVASWSPTGDGVPPGTRRMADGDNVTAQVLRTGRPARMDSYDEATGAIAPMLRDLGMRSSVGAPIVVDQRLWGVMIVSSKGEDPLPVETESRIAAFTNLVATAISNTEERAERGRLTEEQAALRRVATLVAKGVPERELFDAVVAEAGGLLDADLAGMIHYLDDQTITATATWAAHGEHPPVTGDWPLEGDRMASSILASRRPTREDRWGDAAGPIAEFVRDVLGVRSTVGSPIVVEGRVWGALFVHSTTDQPLPPTTESRLANVTELVATAIANGEARSEVRRLADEQAALRRVATLVARESPAAEVFAAVAEEVGRVLQVQDTRILRYESDETATVLASWGKLARDIPVGTRWRLDGENVSTKVLRTGQAARKDYYGDASGDIGDRVQERGIRSAVGTPILVEGRLWGVLLVASLTEEPLPHDAEPRIREFTELVATAISNIETRSELAASRARVVAAADDERRRVVRDLHDGAQQRLVHTVVTLKLAQRALAKGDASAPELVANALTQADSANAELRELAQGILPAVLTRGGLRAGADALASRSPVPVVVDVLGDRLPTEIEATAYFVVAEALTNVAKHSQATRATVRARSEEGMLRLEVRDNGVGCTASEGSGLVGLRDRLAALDGRLKVDSPHDGGTVLVGEIPVPG